MSKNLLTYLLLSTLFLPTLLWAQTEESYKPRIFGTLKSDYEISLENGEGRFTTRNARFGVLGKVNRHIGYKFQTDLSDMGKFKVLDTYGEIYATDKLTFLVGQMYIPFAENYVITPGQYLFTSMSFLYPYVSAPARDIGVNVQYVDNLWNIPFTLQAGVFNGSGINNPAWEKQPAMAARLIFGDLSKGFRSSLKYYTNMSGLHKVNAYGLDLRYNAPRWKVEGEWNTCDSVHVDQLSMSAYFLQGAYKVYVKEEAEMIKFIMATGRLESIGNEVFKNGFSVSRITIGLNFGFDVKPLKGEVRVNYESAFVRKDKDPIFLKQFEKKPDVVNNRVLQDRIIFELLLNL